MQVYLVKCRCIRRSRAVVQTSEGGVGVGWGRGRGSYLTKALRRSMGIGNMMVEFFSAEI